MVALTVADFMSVKDPRGAQQQDFFFFKVTLESDSFLIGVFLCERASCLKGQQWPQ